MLRMRMEALSWIWNGFWMSTEEMKKNTQRA